MRHPGTSWDKYARYHLNGMPANMPANMPAILRDQYRRARRIFPLERDSL